MLNSFTTERAGDAVRVDEFYIRRLSLISGAYVCLEVIDISNYGRSKSWMRSNSSSILTCKRLFSQVVK